MEIVISDITPIAPVKGRGFFVSLKIFKMKNEESAQDDVHNEILLLFNNSVNLTRIRWSGISASEAICKFFEIRKVSVLLNCDVELFILIYAHIKMIGELYKEDLFRLAALGFNLKGLLSERYGKEWLQAFDEGIKSGRNMNVVYIDEAIDLFIKKYYR